MLWIDQAEPSSSILKEAPASPDAVTVDIYWATLPDEFDPQDESLWSFVQEDRLDAALRLRLQKNGIRAGVVGGAPPEQIVRMLNPSGEEVTAGTERQAEELLNITGVTGSTQQLRPGRVATIQASQVLAEAPLVIAERDRVSGETFENVQPVYALRIEKETDGGYTLVLTPELHYGESKMRWSSDETGLIALGAPTREKRVFNELRIEAPLVVGEMLIATSRPGAGSSLGHYFHQADSGVAGQRKAILVRLTQTPPAADFVANLEQRSW